VVYGRGVSTAAACPCKRGPRGAASRRPRRDLLEGAIEEGDRDPSDVQEVHQGRPEESRGGVATISGGAGRARREGALASTAPVRRARDVDARARPRRDDRGGSQAGGGRRERRAHDVVLAAGAACPDEVLDEHSEKDLESAILRELERFLLELGVGFALVERQKRITLDGDDDDLDLLFFHRRMQRLVAIELKIGDFKPADSGQMELYLRWLDRNDRQPSEQAPLGIILCAGKKRETVSYLDLDARGIHVAEYLTVLPPREVLEDHLHRAIEAARNRLVLDASRRRCGSARSDVDDA